MDLVTFLSYNSTGLDSLKVQFSHDICSEYDVDFLSIQEHFKFVNCDKYFKSSYTEYSSYVIPGHREPGQMYGRAKAGLAQLIRRDCDVKMTRISSDCFRVQAQVLKLPNSRILWLNTYLPCDPQLQQYDDSELQAVLKSVKDVINTAEFDDIIWGSDLNWDPSRDNHFSRCLSTYIQQLGLVSVWQDHPVPYTHIHTDGHSRSVLDHFLISPRLLSLIDSCGIIERGDNRSRHCPIWIKLKLGSLPLKNLGPKWISKRPAWSTASAENKKIFKLTLDERLSSLECPIEALCCTDVKCKSADHSHIRDKYVLDILSSIIEVSHEAIPMYGGYWLGKKMSGGTVPGWNIHVKPFRNASIYWGDIWKNNGRPNSGWIYDQYVLSRRQFHQAILKVKKYRNQLQAENLLGASLQGDINLLKEMKKIRQGKGGSQDLPDIVGNAVGEQEISEMFRESYNNLYNSVPSGYEMDKILKSLEKMDLWQSGQEIEKINVAIVKNAVCKLKPLKSDVSGSFVSDALKNAPDILFHQIAAIFRSWLYHGSVTESLLACSFLPILKSSLKDPANPGSYRAIAGSSLILKVFEMVVLLLWGHLLSSDSLQFGYKAKTSTVQCTWMVSEVVQLMLRNGISPIVTVLDCSKAFDKCKFSILFQRLMERGLPPVVIRVLAYVYMNQYGWVRWGTSSSSLMNLTNGTRQGAILSPYFWAVYLDPLLVRLRQLGLGAYIGGLFMGAVCYADDVLLIAPSRGAMQRMLYEVEMFAAEASIEFSTDPDPKKSKSKCIFVTGNKRNVEKPAPLKLCGRELPYVKEADHLGNIITENGDMDKDAAIKRAAFVQSSVQIREQFKFAAPADIIKALKVHSNSFYGSNLWDLNGDKASQLYAAWNTTIKMVWNCPIQTRTYFLQQILYCGYTSAKVDIISRYPTFFRSLLDSPGKELRVLSRLVSRDIRSTTGGNLAFIRKTTGLNPWEAKGLGLKQRLCQSEMVQVLEEDKWRIPYLRKLLTFRRLSDDQETQTYIEELIQSLVVN